MKIKIPKEKKDVSYLIGIDLKQLLILDISREKLYSILLVSSNQQDGKNHF